MGRAASTSLRRRAPPATLVAGGEQKRPARPGASTRSPSRRRGRARRRPSDRLGAHDAQVDGIGQGLEIVVAGSGRCHPPVARSEHPALVAHLAAEEHEALASAWSWAEPM